MLRRKEIHNWNSNDTIIYRDENEEPKGFKKEPSNYRKDKNHKKIRETHRVSQTKRNNAKPKYFYNKITVHQNKLMYI